MLNHAGLGNAGSCCMRRGHPPARRAGAAARDAAFNTENVMATGSMLRTWWWMLAVAGLGALPAQAQRVSLTDLQNQIAALQNQIAASATCPAALPSQPRFVDKGDGTICDSATGLMWEKKLPCSDLTNPRCVDNTYTWSRALPFTAPTGTLYYEFLDRLNDLKDPNDGAATPCFAGHCDWRIPTIGELRSIFSPASPNCTVSPCIDAIFGPTLANVYWSSSTFAPVPTVAFVGIFFYGSVEGGPGGPFYKSNNLYARAVRGGR